MSPTPSSDEIVLYTNTELNRNGRSFESTWAKKSNEKPLLKFVAVILLLFCSRVVFLQQQRRSLFGYLRLLSLCRLQSLYTSSGTWYNMMRDEDDDE